MQQYLNNPIVAKVQPITKLEIVDTVETKILETPVQLSLFSEVAGGQSETLNKTRSSRKTGGKKPASSNESSTHLEFFQGASV